MTTPTWEVVVDQETQNKAEQARRAVSVFRGMIPTLSAYARALTNNPKVRVVLDSGNIRTDGKVIYAKPPITLGAIVKHDRVVCEKRKDFVLICPACAQREDVLIKIYHEISHIVFDSFAGADEKAKMLAVREAVKTLGKKGAARLEAELKKMEKIDYLQLANNISPFLPALNNAMEDARINSEMFRTRPGTKAMFFSLMKRVFDDGIINADGGIVQWREQPLNAQIILGVFCKAAGHKYKGYLHEDIEAALADPKLTELLKSAMETADSAKAVFGSAFPVMERLNELGYCQMPPPEEEEDDEESEPDEAGGPGESEESEDDEGDGEQESGGSGSGEPDSEADPSDEKSDDRNDQSDSLSDDDKKQPEDSSEKDSSDGEEESGGSDSSSEADSCDSGTESQGNGGEPKQDAGNSPPKENNLSDDGADIDASDSEALEGSGDISGPESEGSREDQKDQRSESSSDKGSDSRNDPESGQSDVGEQSLLDTGADEGEGGTKTESREMGNSTVVEEIFAAFCDHSGTEGHEVKSGESANDEAEVVVAVIQGAYFERPSVYVHGVRVHTPDKHVFYEGRDMARAWTHGYGTGYGSKHASSYRQDRRIRHDIAESILGPALLRMRVAFADNKRATEAGNKKSGRVNTRVLGRRVHFDDDRLFKKRTIPGKRDYAVCIGIDVSGSTAGMNNHLLKRAAYAQAELCDRTGVKFAIYAHSGKEGGEQGTEYEVDLDIYQIKTFDEPWGPKQQDALLTLGHDSSNLDGHALEFLRKRLDERTETEKVLMYYSDGKFPAENHDEELEIINHEISLMRRLRYTLMAVGIRTDSPKRHGFDTVEVYDDNDLVKVVKLLEKRLSVKLA